MSLDLLLFAAVAAFLVFRLRSVLGRRMGNERRPMGTSETPSNPQPQAATDNADEKNVVALPDRNPDDPFIEQAEGALGEHLREIRKSDPDFNTIKFSEGAKGAFEMIVTSFATGDTDTLKPLLSDDETVWKAHALILMGDYFISKKENIKAIEFYQKIFNIKNLHADLYSHARLQLTIISNE